MQKVIVRVLAMVTLLSHASFSNAEEKNSVFYLIAECMVQITSEAELEAVYAATSAFEKSPSIDNKNGLVIMGHIAKEKASSCAPWIKQDDNGPEARGIKLLLSWYSFRIMSDYHKATHGVDLSESRTRRFLKVVSLQEQNATGLRKVMDGFYLPLNPPE
jgi:hypothetical protein|tara:strand:- start:442 stop:921 length:480 start_codon:yes stop_codon:yes gene_type:complete